MLLSFEWKYTLAPSKNSSCKFKTKYSIIRRRRKISWCFEPSQPLAITSGLYNNNNNTKTCISPYPFRKSTQGAFHYLILDKGWDFKICRMIIEWMYVQNIQTVWCFISAHLMICSLTRGYIELRFERQHRRTVTNKRRRRVPSDWGRMYGSSMTVASSSEQGNTKNF